MYSSMDLPMGVSPICQALMYQHVESVKVDPLLKPVGEGVAQAYAGLPWNMFIDQGVAVSADQEETMELETPGATFRRRRRRGGRKHGKPHHFEVGGSYTNPGGTATRPPRPLTAQDTAAGERIKTIDAASMELQEHDPLSLPGNPDLCNEFVMLLETDSFDKDAFLDWVLQYALPLALSEQCASRVIQKLLEVLQPSARDRLVAQLCADTISLYESPHGNHVLTKVIEVVPRPALKPILEQMRLQGGRAVARHRFGCRILERLVEHGDEVQTNCLTDQCIEHAEELSRHEFGNFVIQSLLEHGSPRQRGAIILQLLPFIPQLSMHRTASHVVQQALKYGSEEWQHAIVNALLYAATPAPFLHIAASRYGSYVVEEVHSIFGEEGPGQRVKQSLQMGLLAVAESVVFARVAARFGLLPEVDAQ